MQTLRKYRYFLKACGGVLLLGLLAVTTARMLGMDTAVLNGWVNALVEYLMERPVMTFLAIAILPSLFFPVSILLLTAGVVYGKQHNLFLASLIALMAMVINFSWTYWVARFPARRLIERLVRKFDVEIPALPVHHMLRFTLILRITPGIPFFLQNYVLGLASIPFRPYFIVSFLTQIGWTFGFVISGGSLFEGRTGLAITGICVLIVAALITQVLRKRLGAPPPMDAA